MRKDFIETQPSSDEDEIAFIERHWTDVWEKQGGPQNVANKIPKKPEFRIMRRYLDSLPGGASILDGGCGLGDWTVCLSKLGFDSLGLDISRATIELLNTRFPEQRFSVGDIRKTGLSDMSFDGYFSWGTFEHFENGLGDCIDEAYRILKPGGFLFISVPYDNMRHAIHAAFSSSGRSFPSGAARRFYQWRLTKGELRDELNHGGFEVLRVHHIHKRQGALRCLHHEFGLPYNRLFTKGLATVVAPFVPGGLIAHMIMAVAQKPGKF